MAMNTFKQERISYKHVDDILHCQALTFRIVIVGKQLLAEDLACAGDGRLLTSRVDASGSA